jgi:hypothetical protein
MREHSDRAPSTLEARKRNDLIAADLLDVWFIQLAIVSSTVAASRFATTENAVMSTRESKGDLAAAKRSRVKASAGCCLPNSPAQI